MTYAEFDKNAWILPNFDNSSNHYSSM